MKIKELSKMWNEYRNYKSPFEYDGYAIVKVTFKNGICKYHVYSPGFSRKDPLIVCDTIETAEKAIEIHKDIKASGVIIKTEYIHRGDQ